MSGREAELSRAKSRGEWGFAIEARSGQVEALRRILLDGRDWTEIEHERRRLGHRGRGPGGIRRGRRGFGCHLAGEPRRRDPGGDRGDPDAVTRAVRHLGANLLVVEPAGRSIYLLRQVAERFRQGGAPVVPHDLTDAGGLPMRIAEVIGRVTLSRSTPASGGPGSSSPVRCRPRPWSTTPGPSGEEVVAFDDLGAGPGALIGLSEGAEAANPFRPAKRPIDAYNACLIDRLYL